MSSSKKRSVSVGSMSTEKKEPVVTLATKSESTNTTEDSWKTYFSNVGGDHVALLSQITQQINGDDPNMATSLGFLYEYYSGVNEDAANAGTSSSCPELEQIEGGPGSVGTDDGESSPSSPEKQVFSHSSMHSMKLSASDQDIKSATTSVIETSHDRQLAIKSSPTSPEDFHYSQHQIKTSASTTASACRMSSRPITVNYSSPASSSKSSVTDASALLSSSPEGYNFIPYVQAVKTPPTVFSAQDKYAFLLEAPPSIIQRRGEDTLTYLNKGQFYAITFEGNLGVLDSEITRLKSVVHIVFRDEKDPRTEIEHWEYWHRQQPNPQQRAFDIDRKSCLNIDEQIDDVGYNAAGFTWCPNLGAKVVLRINCLSTDFSPQKGVKGIPLHLQIDTYEDLSSPDAEPVHRALCQIKIFRDKGAERKNKDESKSAERRLQKWMKQTPSGDTSPGTSGSSGMSPGMFQLPSKYTKLLATTPLGPRPVVFTPSGRSLQGNSSALLDDTTVQTSSLLAAIRERENKRTLKTSVNVAKDEFADLEVVPKPKCQRVQKNSPPAVTIYVKKEEEKVYNALMLESLTVPDLLESIGNKYNMPPDMIKNVYKRTKKGLLVNMDDRMIEQFVDEDDFIITLDFDNQLGNFELTLQY